jgi:hypothetical protein
MNVDLTAEQRDLLLRLVNAALRDIGPEIRHTMTSTYKDDLKAERRDLQGVRDLLISGAPSDHVVAPGLYGTP